MADAELVSFAAPPYIPVMVMGITIPALLPKQRIVVIDDEPGFAKSLAIMLGSLGYEVVISTDASNVLDLHEEDIVFFGHPYAEHIRLAGLGTTVTARADLRHSINERERRKP